MEEPVHSSGWEKILFLSTLDEPRNKTDVSKQWDVTVSGGPLYKKSTNRGIQSFLEHNLIRKDGSKYKANLNSDKFKNLLRKRLESGNDVIQTFGQDIDGFVDMLNQDKIKNNLLTPETIKKTFAGNKQDKIKRIREEELTTFFKLILDCYVDIWVDESLSNHDMVGDMLEGMAKGMFSGFLNSVKEETTLDIDYLISEIRDIHKESPESFDYIKDGYNSVLEDQFNQMKA